MKLKFELCIPGLKIDVYFIVMKCLKNPIVLSAVALYNYTDKSQLVEHTLYNTKNN